MTRPLAVTMGDPSGIGPEIILKAFANRGIGAAVVVGDEARLTALSKILNLGVACRQVASVSDARFDPGTVNVLQVGGSVAALPFGAVSSDAGKAAYSYVERAIALALAGQVSGIVTAPINKEALASAGIRYPGHTEILAAHARVDDVAMMLASPELRVVLVTIHQPLMSVGPSLTVERELAVIRMAHSALRGMGIAAPRIAVAGLNPHAGENGLFGQEDEEIIRPAVAAARSEGIDASGPWPGDTVFLRAREGAFDIVVAQYHDQGLIPVKYLGIDTGVNVTLGLPFVRTSVDHGTAFDIAGTGQADPASLIHALHHAAKLTRGLQ